MQPIKVLLGLLALIAVACGGTSEEVDLTIKPVIEIPGGDAPTELLSEDIVTGNGEIADSGDLLVMHYVGVLHEDGSEFDSSWDRDDTFTFVLGQGRVIQGWDEGIVGMTEGSRRQLTIPAAQAYGDTGAGAAIPPGASLIFVVDLVNAYAPHDLDPSVTDPEALQVTELESGDGAELAEGDIVEVLYSIAPASLGEVAQSSWTDGATGRFVIGAGSCLLYTSPSPRDQRGSRMPSSA